MSDTPALSPSIAHVLETESPLHAWTVHRLLGNKPTPSTEAQEKGSLVHALLFDDPVERFAVIDADSYRTKAAQEARDAARVAGKVPILSEKFASLATMVARIQARIAEFGYDLTKGASEQECEWTESGASTGARVLCHGRIDWIRHDRQLVLDLKTTEGSAHPDVCAAKLLRTAGVIQDAAYRRAIEIAHPELAGRIEVVFLFAQTVEPYAVTPIICGTSMREIGVGRWRRAVETWAKCLRTNEWPSYAKYPQTVEAPAWALAREMLEEV